MFPRDCEPNDEIVAMFYLISSHHSPLYWVYLVQVRLKLRLLGFNTSTPTVVLFLRTKAVLQNREWMNYILFFVGLIGAGVVATNFVSASSSS